jgi:hypothetical protein
VRPEPWRTVEGRLSAWVRTHVLGAETVRSQYITSLAETHCPGHQTAKDSHWAYGEISRENKRSTYQCGWMNSELCPQQASYFSPYKWLCNLRASFWWQTGRARVLTQRLGS